MPWYDGFDAIIKREFSHLEVLCQEPMSAHTSFRIGGPARRFVRPDSAGAMTALLALARREGWPALTMGNGSNLLFTDGEVERLVVHTGGLNRLERAGATRVRAGAGVTLARLASFAQREGLAGLAFAHGIPGTLGGGIYMNAGAYGGELCQAVAAVTAWFPGEGTVRLEGEALEFGYRRSIFQRRPGTVLEAELELLPGDRDAIRREMEDLSRRRREKQPLEYPSAGSAFKRPPQGYAAALIDRCGLRGLRAGGAQVSEKHAGFIVNTGGATCEDVLTLIERVRERVLRETGVALEMEIQVIQ